MKSYTKSKCIFFHSKLHISPKMRPLTLLYTLLLPVATSAASCRSYCGNLTVDYPFATRPGCGHPAYRNLLFCINDFLLLHVVSGSYRVLNIDYAYKSLTLHDPHMSTCHDILLSSAATGFSLEPSRSPFLSPDPNNAFLLIRCSDESPLFQGFPRQHLPCRNISGLGCEEFLTCPGWASVGRRRVGLKSGPMDCCAVSFESIKSVNLTKLKCEGYSSVYSVAPLKPNGPDDWAYGIRVAYSSEQDDAFCKSCVATGGACGYAERGGDAVEELCLCGSWNSTTNCDSSKFPNTNN
uniref:Wall-associated receptor kinase galacturonan-binding domain-containing protein n=1 Tax=Kalanchoe fedtschenkoi TaxID=63787 RepID=A0A7N0RAL0_KALFE